MRTVDIITKKRDGGELTRAEIDAFIQGYVAGDIPDYQAAAWAMAVFFRGMSSAETAMLTEAMAFSGDTLDLHDTLPFIVDKHSSGGVGDKTTLVVGPMVATLGVPVGKMSGRGLSFSGGTLDKLESIPGFSVRLSLDQFKRQLKEIGLVVAGQTKELAPADGKLYALRDVTGTVPSLPLIASSIMSKKIAAGADAIVLDVKVGQGAFMETVPAATELAQLMVDIGRHLGRKMAALIGDMSQPLGLAVGNALEVKEAVATLRGAGPADFVRHCVDVSAAMLMIAGLYDDPYAAGAAAHGALADGRAFDKFRQFVLAQGGDLAYVDDPERLPARRVRRGISGARGRVYPPGRCARGWVYGRGPGGRTRPQRGRDRAFSGGDAGAVDEGGPSGANRAATADSSCGECREPRCSAGAAITRHCHRRGACGGAPADPPGHSLGGRSRKPGGPAMCLDVGGQGL